MNYNLSAIMKKAWEIKKENILNLFAPSLKMAWSIVKKGVEIMNEITIGSEKQIAWATKIRQQCIKDLESEITELKYRTTSTSINLNNIIQDLQKAVEDIKVTPQTAKQIGLYKKQKQNILNNKQIMVRTNP